MLDVIQRMHRDVVVSTMVGDIKVKVQNGGGVKQGDNPAPIHSRAVVQAIVEVYKEKYPAVQFEFRCNTRQEGDRAGCVAGAPELAVRMLANFLLCSFSVSMQMT